MNKYILITDKTIPVIATPLPVGLTQRPIMPRIKLIKGKRNPNRVGTSSMEATPSINDVNATLLEGFCWSWG